MAAKASGGRQKTTTRERTKVARAREQGKARVGRTIDAAAEASKRGRKPGLTAAQKATRDSAIIARSAQGWTHARVAEAFDVSKRQVERIVAEHRNMPSGMDTAPMQLVEDLLRQLRRMEGDFEAMAAAYAESHPGVSVQAKRQARDTLADRVELQRMLGLLPTNLGLFRAEADLRHLGEQVLDKLAEFEKGHLSAGEVARLVREEVFAEALRDLPARR